MEFLSIASVSTRNIINDQYFPKFKRIFRLNDVAKLTDFDNLNINLNGLLPPIAQLEFQRSEVCSIAYKICNIKIPQIDAELWRRIFSGEDNGYIKIRNKLIHGGFEASLKYANLLNKDFIEEVILDIIKFAHKVDLKIVTKYPFNEFPHR